MQREAILNAAGRVVDEIYIGVMSTVDAHGRPSGRYMGAVLDAERLRLCALSAKERRKVEHLTHNRHVCWCFMRHDGSEAVTIRGQGSVHETTVLPSEAWYQLSEFVEPYQMHVSSDQRHHAFVALVTRIESIEYLNPSNGVTQPERVGMA